MPSHWHRIAVTRRRHVGVASPSRVAGVSSREGVSLPPRRLRVEKFSRRHRLGIAPLQASRRRRVGVADAKSSHRLSRRVGVKSFFACRHVGIASLSRADLAKAPLRHHHNVVIASPSCRRRIAAVKLSRWRPMPSRRRRVNLESRRRRLAVASVSRLFLHAVASTSHCEVFASRRVSSLRHRLGVALELLRRRFADAKESRWR